MTEPSELVYMSAKQVAEYLDLNEKKVYAMANDRMLPATKITGKWLFPKILIDRWYKGRVKRIEEVFQETARIISQVTKNVSLVLAPQMTQAQLFKKLENEQVALYGKPLRCEI